MKQKWVKRVTFFLICGVAVVLGVSAIGFSLRGYHRIFKDQGFQEFESDLGMIRGTLQIDRARRQAIQQIMTIIEKYNQEMPSSMRYAIASEIYQMDVKYDNLNTDLICATITHESAATWNPRIVSGKGAMGLMQIMPKTGRNMALLESIPWSDAESVLFNPVLNIRLGCRYLSSLIDLYGVEGGLAAYNGGEKKAAMWLANNKADGILYQETQNYVPAVMRLYYEYKN